MNATGREGVQFICVDPSDADDAAMVHCPLCGQAALGPDGDAGDCAHLLFVYLCNAGEFEHQRTDFAERCCDRDSIDWTLDGFREQLDVLGYDARLLVFALRRTGMACGPVGSMELYGFLLD